MTEKHKKPGLHSSTGLSGELNSTAGTVACTHSHSRAGILQRFHSLLQRRYFTLQCRGIGLSFPCSRIRIFSIIPSINTNHYSCNRNARVNQQIGRAHV